MSVAKEIQKAGESWKDAMERAKQVLKERREGVVAQKKSELEKLFALVKTKKELQGFAFGKSDIERDSVRESKVKGSRVVTREGFTSNQYKKNVPNKLGRKYWESRENRSDRLAPNYQKDMPLLARGGAVTETMIVNMPDGSDIKVETKSGIISKISKRVSVDESRNSVLFYKLPADLQQKINKRLNPNALADGGMFEAPIPMMREVKGKTVNVPVSEEIYSSEISEFVDYVDGFYGKKGIYAEDLDGGFTKAEIKKAVNKYIENLNANGTWGGGDSLDRERVRQILQPSYRLYKHGGSVEVGDRVIITTTSLGKDYVGMSGTINDRKLLNDKYSVKLANGLDMAFSKDEFKHDSINPRFLDGGMNNLTTQNVSFAKGGSVKKVPAYAKKRLEELRKELRAETISYGELAELQSLAKYIDPNDVELLEPAGVPEFDEDDDNYAKGGKLTKSEVIRNMYKPSGDYFFEQKGNDLIVHLTSRDAGNSITNLMDKYDVKDNGKGYYGSSYILSRKNKLANGGSLPFMTDPNFGNFQNTGAFAKGGSVKKVPAYAKRRLEELRKEIREESISTGEIAELESLKQYIDPSDVELLQWAGVPEFEEEDYAKGGELKDFEQTVKDALKVNNKWHFISQNVDGKSVQLKMYVGTKEVDVQIFKIDGVYASMPKNYAGKRETLKMIMNNFNANYELGGAFMMTDLAGHTGGSDGLGNQTPLSGVSGTYYTGLVGETGAMSSGELFMDGGVMAQNQQVINDASQSYVNYYLGEGASQGIYKDGGSIPNNYAGRTPEDVWDNWSSEQKIHFMQDHKYNIFGDRQISKEDREKFIITKFQDLSRDLRIIVEDHVQEGQYASGGSLGEELMGGQSNATLKPSGYHLVSAKGREIIVSDDGGNSKERWVKNNGFSGYRLVYKGNDYEFTDSFESGGFTPDVSDGTQFMNGVYANGGGIRSQEELKKIFSEKEAIVKNLTPKQIAEMWNKNSFGVKEGISKPITIEEAKKPSMKMYLENLLIENELTEEEQAKYFAKGGFVGTVEFNVGDIVWQKNEKGYGTVMNNYGDPINGDYGDIRLDTTGNTSIYSFDPKRKTPATIETATGYNLFKLGEKGDTGKFTPKVLSEMKEAGKRYIGYAKENKGSQQKENIAYYEGIYKRLLDGEFDSFAKPTISSETTYVPNADVKELSVVVKGELKKLTGSDIVNGVYVKNSAKSTSKVDVNAVFAKILKDAKEAKSGKTKRFDASDLKKINVEMVQKLVDAGYTEQQIRNIIFGYAFDNEIVADNELEYDYGVFAYEENYIKEKIDNLVEAQKNKEFVAGIEYPDFDWQSIIKKYKISSKPKEIVIKRNFGGGRYIEYYYEVFVGENIALGHNFGYKDFDANGKLTGDYIEKGKKVSDPTKQNAWQKERSQKAGFNGGYWYVVSSKIETIDDVLKTLLSQKGGYCKELELYSDSFPKTLKENKIAFADGGFMNNVYANGGQMKVNDINSELEDFDLDNLDPFETMQYDNYSKSMSKVDALQILINTVEGDYSQLSPELAELAEMQISSQEWEEQYYRDNGFAKGGMTGSDYNNSPDYKTLRDKFDKLHFDVKSKVVIAVGLDRAIEFYDADLTIAPYRFIERAVTGNFISLNEINKRLIDSAMEEAEEIDNDEDLEEIGSSDFTYYLKNVLDGAGLKVGFVGSRLERLNEDGSIKEINNGFFEDGGFMNDVYAKGGSTDILSVNKASILSATKKCTHGDSDYSTCQSGNFEVTMTYAFNSLFLDFVYLDYNNPRFNPSKEHYASYAYTKGSKGILTDFDQTVYTKQGRRTDAKTIISKTIEVLKSLGYPVDSIVDRDGEEVEDAKYANGGSLNVVEERELKTFVNSLFNRAKNKIANDKGNSLFVLSDTVIATKDSLGNPKFYLGVKKVQNSRPTYVVGSGFLSSDMLVYESYKKDSRFLETESIVEAKKFLTDKVKKQILHLRNKSVMADGGFMNNVYAKGGELQGKFLAEIKVPYNFEYVVEDEYEFSRFLSKALTNKFNFGNGAWGVKIVKPLFEKDYSKKIVVEIEIPVGVTQGGGLDKFDVLEFMSKTLTKKWFGNGVWGVDVVKSFADGGFLNENQIENLDEGFTIPQLNDMLDEMFPNSFGFEVYKQEQSSSRNEGKFSYDYENKVIKDDKLKLYFYYQGYGRDLNYQVSQGQENTYFKFLLVDDKINTYVGGFGFKDKGDVDESYITKFISFLQDAYHYPFKVRHSVMADGGSLMGVHDGTAFMQNPVYAEKGSYLQDNEGFMRADNEFNYRYPEKEVYIETLDEPIDLTDTITIKSNEVVISPIDENIDLNDDNRIRARMTQSNRGSAEKFGQINPRAYEFIPMPKSNKHKND